MLKGPWTGLFGGVHLLPFFYPIDGADAGFDPIDHTQIDRRLGTWEDLRALGDDRRDHGRFDCESHLGALAAV